MNKARRAELALAGGGFEAGDVYSFRTSPTCEFSPKETGRYAAIKVLGVKDKNAVYVVLDAVFGRHPELAQVTSLAWLHSTRFLHRGNPACHHAPLDWENDLADFHYVGTVDVTPDEKELMSSCRSYGSWSTANSEAEGEWRWRNDRAAYEVEVGLEKQARQAREAAARERYQLRLKGLTWEKLLEELPFQRWQEGPPFPPEAFVTAARERIRSLLLELQALGPKPKKAQVRAALKRCVEWFNAKDAEFGGVIETEEREDIYALLEELAFVARQPSLVEEIDAWRHW
jgi:hypothetical protein